MDFIVWKKSIDWLKWWFYCSNFVLVWMSQPQISTVYICCYIISLLHSQLHYVFNLVNIGFQLICWFSWWYSCCTGVVFYLYCQPLLFLLPLLPRFWYSFNEYYRYLPIFYYSLNPVRCLNHAWSLPKINFSFSVVFKKNVFVTNVVLLSLHCLLQLLLINIVVATATAAVSDATATVVIVAAKLLYIDGPVATATVNVVSATAAVATPFPEADDHHDISGANRQIVIMITALIIDHF